MNRPLLRPGLDPTLGEFLIFLIWLALVILAIIEMVRIPAFSLVFWPILWIYDLATAGRPRNSLDPVDEAPSKPSRLPPSLWDRELDM